MTICITASKNRLKYWILVLMLAKPVGLDGIFPMLDAVWDILKLLAAVYIFLWFLKQNRKQSNNLLLRYLVCCGVVFLLILFSSVVNGRSFTGLFLLEWVTSLICIMLLGVSNNRNDLEDLIVCFSSVFNMLILINAVCFLVAPEGMGTFPRRERWFLGDDNAMTVYTMPAFVLNVMVLSIFRTKKKEKFLRIFIMLLIVYLHYYRWTVTALVIMTLMLFGCLIFRFKWLARICSYISGKMYMLFSAGLFLGIVIFQIQNQFSYFLVEVLKKDISFTGRTYVWKRTLEMIRRHWVLGYGNIEEITSIRDLTHITQASDYFSVGHAHNYFLDMWLKGGVLCLAVFLYIIYLIFVQLDRGIGLCAVYCKMTMFLICLFFMVTLPMANSFGLYFLMGLFIIIPQLEKNVAASCG